MPATASKNSSHNKTKNLPKASTNQKTQRPETDSIPGLDVSEVTTQDLLTEGKKLISPISGRLLCGLLSAFAMAAMSLLTPQALQWVIDLFTQGNPSIWLIALGAGTFTGFRILESFFSVLRRFFIITPSTEVEKIMRINFYNHVQRSSMDFHNQIRSGQLLNIITGDIGRIRRWIAFTGILFITNVITVIVGLIILLITSPLMGLIIATACIPAIIGQVLYIKKYTPLSQQSQDQSSELNTEVEESVQGIQVVKALGASTYLFDRFISHARSLKSAEIQKSQLDAKLMISLSIPELALSLCLILGIYLTVQSVISLGALAAFFATATIILGPLSSLVPLISNTVNMQTSARRYLAVMKINDVINFHEKSSESAQYVIEKKLDKKWRPELSFENVSFSYEGSEKKTLNAIDLKISAGQTIALVGASGSGKTTLLNLIPRLYDVDEGKISFDQTNIQEFSSTDLRTVSATAQEAPMIFSDTIAENILLNSQGTLKEKTDLLDHSLQISEAEFVKNLPEGVDTQVGENGLTLSGGQRQRLSLARTIATSPRLLLLDDPLSAVDATTEEKIIENLKTQLDHLTTIIVAHRTSTVVLADKVAYLKNGTIAAFDTHSNLLQNPDYAQLMRGQPGDDE